MIFTCNDCLNAISLLLAFVVVTMVSFLRSCCLLRCLVLFVGDGAVRYGNGGAREDGCACVLGLTFNFLHQHDVSLLRASSSFEY